MFGRNLFFNNKQYVRRNFVVRKNSPTNFDNFSHVSPLSTGMGKHNSIIIFFLFANTNYLFQLCEFSQFLYTIMKKCNKMYLQTTVLYQLHINEQNYDNSFRNVCPSPKSTVVKTKGVFTDFLFPTFPTYCSAICGYSNLL